MAGIFWAMNAAFPTTAAPVKMATGTSIKTLLQVATPSSTSIQVIEWGISFDGTVVNTPVQCELVDTGTVGATSLTAVTPALYGNPTGEVSLCVGGLVGDRVQLRVLRRGQHRQYPLRGRAADRPDEPVCQAVPAGAVICDPSLALPADTGDGELAR